jgi:hypothetical protein
MEQVGNQELPHKKQLTSEQKWHILVKYFKLCRSDTERLIPGGMEILQARFNVPARTIYNIVEEFLLQDQDINRTPDLSRKRKSDSDERIMLTEDLRQCLLEFNSNEGYALPIRSFAVRFNAVYGTDFSYSSLEKYMKLIGKRTRVSSIKPTLKDSHKIRRLDWILHKLELNEDNNWQFKDEKHVIDVDEKWFFVDRETRNIRQLEGEERHNDENTQHKGHIEKVLFAAAVGCPQVRPDGTFFDGKIGIWPVVEETYAIRASINRPAGAQVIKPLTLDSDRYREAYEQPGGIFAMIKDKMAWLKDNIIQVQHDGASPHTGKGNGDALERLGKVDDWNICFETQPAQSPDLNKLDLCLFNSLDKQAHLLKGDGKSIPELIFSVIGAFEAYPSAALERVHALKHEIYRQILKNEGGNQYNLPHTTIRYCQNHQQDSLDRIVPMEIRLRGVEALDRLTNMDGDSDEENMG